MSGDPFENTAEKYKSFSEHELSLKNAFSYDDHKGFSDLKFSRCKINKDFLKWKTCMDCPGSISVMSITLTTSATD